MYGVELEFENVNGTTQKTIVSDGLWKKHLEHSLRGGGAMEIVTSMPMPLTAVNSQLVRIYELLGTGFVSNHRTGMHVHVNLLENTYDSFKRLVALWVLLEPVYMKTTAPERKRHIFCWQVGEALGDWHNFADVFQLDDWDFRFLDNTKWNRYTTFNLASLVKHGTVEFRYIQTPQTLEAAMSHMTRIDSLINFSKLWDTAPDGIPELLMQGDDVISMLNLKKSDVQNAVQERAPLLHMMLERNTLIAHDLTL
jgi:hypothetical protein